MDKITGNKGEALAEHFIKKKGWTLLERNYTNCLGEIDLIAKQDNTIVFIEVKTRTTKKYGLPREAVTYTKQKKIRQVALLYLKKSRELDIPCRFDVIEVNGEDNLIHIPNAF